METMVLPYLLVPAALYASHSSHLSLFACKYLVLLQIFGHFCKYLDIVVNIRL